MFFAGTLVSCESNRAALEGDRYDSGTVHISCDETFRPVIDEQVKVYEASYPKTKLIVHYKPEAECLRDLLVDSIRMVIATRGFSVSEKGVIADSLKVEPWQQTVAYDALAVIVHPRARQDMFSLQELRDIFSGKNSKGIKPVVDGNRATSTVRYVIDSLLQGGNLGANVAAAESSVGVIDYVAKTPEAVGLIGVSWIANTEDTAQIRFLEKIKVARMESTDSANHYVLPVQIFIYMRSYPMIRSLVTIVKEKNYGLAGGFANFMAKDRGQLIFRRAYIFPAFRPFYDRSAELTED